MQSAPVLTLALSWLVLFSSSAKALSQNQLDILTETDHRHSGGNSQEVFAQDIGSGSGEPLVIEDLYSSGWPDNQFANEVERLDNPKYFEGDIIASEEEITEAYQPFNPRSYERVKRAARNDKRWPGGIVYYNFHSSVSSSRRRKIQAAIQEFERQTCLQFRRAYGRRDYIKFTAHGNGCSSYVGKQGGSQPITLPGNCNDHGIIVHEIGHAIGFWHEQSRPDRDLYVNIHWENIINGQTKNFEARHNIDYQGESYDYQSVMHYPETAFSANGRKTVSPKNSWASIPSRHRYLSQSDIRQINRMYDCPQASPGYKGTLKVRMIAARDLPDTDGWWNKPDPYACVKAVDRWNNQRKKCTRSIRGTCFPSWNQELNFGASSIGWKYFTITILDRDSGRDDLMMDVQTVWICSGKHYKWFANSYTQWVDFEFNMIV